MRGPYLARGVVTGVEEGPEAVVAVARSRARRQRVGGLALEALVRILVVGAAVTREQAEVALLRGGPFGTLSTALPKSRRLGLVAGGILGQDADNGCGANEQTLEGDHDEMGKDVVGWCGRRRRSQGYWAQGGGLLDVGGCVGLDRCRQRC